MMDWTPAQIAELTRLWGEGVKTSEIGRRLGVTKSAAVGKAHRLSLPGRPSPIKTARPGVTRARVLQRHQKPPRPDPVRPARAAPAPIDRHELRARSNGTPGLYANAETEKKPCAWPIGHPNEPEFHFCGADRVIGKPYCGDHCDLAFVRKGSQGQGRHSAMLERGHTTIDPLNVDRGIATAPENEAA